MLKFLLKHNICSLSQQPNSHRVTDNSVTEPYTTLNDDTDLWCCLRQHSTPHKQHPSYSCDARYGVGDRHEWWMQSRCDSPHCVVANNASQPKCCHHCSEGRVWWNYSQSQQAAQTCSTNTSVTNISQYCSCTLNMVMVLSSTGNLMTICQLL
jgi:hypothetical protein